MYWHLFRRTGKRQRENEAEGSGADVPVRLLGELENSG